MGITLELLGLNNTKDVITTNRLKIRRFTDADIEPYIKIMINPVVTKYLGSGRGVTEKDVIKLITNFESVWDKGYGVFAVLEISTNSLIGHCGIRPIDDGRIEILYAYDPSSWGKGYATEAGNAVLTYAKNNFNLNEVIAMSYPENKGSIAVIKKMGFKHIGQEEHFGNLLDVFALAI